MNGQFPSAAQQLQQFMQTRARAGAWLERQRRMERDAAPAQAPASPPVRTGPAAAGLLAAEPPPRAPIVRAAAAISLTVALGATAASAVVVAGAVRLAPATGARGAAILAVLGILFLYLSVRRIRAAARLAGARPRLIGEAAALTPTAGGHLFRLERRDTLGARVAPVPVRMRGRRFMGSVRDGDCVAVVGRRRRGRPLEATIVYNLTAGLVASRRPRGIALLLGTVLVAAPPLALADAVVRAMQ